MSINPAGGDSGGPCTTDEADMLRPEINPDQSARRQGFHDKPFMSQQQPPVELVYIALCSKGYIP